MGHDRAYLRLVGELPGRGGDDPAGRAYTGGAARLDTWLKAKCRPAQEVVVGGWRTTQGRFRSLLAGVWEGEVLRYVGTVGTGVGAGRLMHLEPQLRRVAAGSSPFGAGRPAALLSRGALGAPRAGRRRGDRLLDRRGPSAAGELQGDARGQAGLRGRAGATGLSRPPHHGS